MRAYKLLRRRKDGTLGPLFINARMRIPTGEWLEAECHPTNGFAVRPGWHCSVAPRAPHLSTKSRIWCEVEIEDFETYERPWNQGSMWFVAKRMRLLRPLDWATVKKITGEVHEHEC